MLSTCQHGFLEAFRANKRREREKYERQQMKIVSRSIDRSLFDAPRRVNTSEGDDGITAVLGEYAKVKEFINSSTVGISNFDFGVESSSQRLPQPPPSSSQQQQHLPTHHYQQQQQPQAQSSSSVYKIISEMTVRFNAPAPLTPIGATPDTTFLGENYNLNGPNKHKYAFDPIGPISPITPNAIEPLTPIAPSGPTPAPPAQATAPAPVPQLQKLNALANKKSATAGGGSFETKPRCKRKRKRSSSSSSSAYKEKKRKKDKKGRESTVAMTAAMLTTTTFVASPLTAAKEKQQSQSVGAMAAPAVENLCTAPNGSRLQLQQQPQPQVIYRSYFERDDNALSYDLSKYNKFLQEAHKRKDAANKEENTFNHLTLYMEAVVYLLLSGAAMENHRTLEYTSPWIIYKTALEIIKYISSIFRHLQVSYSNGQHETHNKVAILNLRCQSITSLKLHKMESNDFKSGKDEIGNGTTPVSTQGSGSNTPIVPQDIHSALQQQNEFFSYISSSHDLWDQADSLVRKENHTDFFIALDHENGPLTLHSTMCEVFCYVQSGLKKLKDDMSIE